MRLLRPTGRSSRAGRRRGRSYLQGFVWPPGSGIRVHVHSPWGADSAAVETALEERATSDSTTASCPTTPVSRRSGN